MRQARATEWDLSGVQLELNRSTTSVFTLCQLDRLLNLDAKECAIETDMSLSELIMPPLSRYVSDRLGWHA